MALGTHAGSSMGPGSLPGIWEAIPWCGNEGGWTAGYRTGDQNWDFERKNYPGFFLDTPPHPALMFDTFSVLHKGFMLGKEGKWSDFESSGRCSAPLFQTKKCVVMMFHWLPRILPDTLLHLFHGYFGSSTKSSAKLEKKINQNLNPVKAISQLRSWGKDKNFGHSIIEAPWAAATQSVTEQSFWRAFHGIADAPGTKRTG